MKMISEGPPEKKFVGDDAALSRPRICLNRAWRRPNQKCSRLSCLHARPAFPAPLTLKLRLI